MENIEKIIKSVYFVNNQSFDVSINYEKLLEFSKKFILVKKSHWLDNNPFNILDLDVEIITQLLLVYHSACFCFWQEPKWTVEIDGIKYDGAYALLGLLVKHFKENNNNFNKEIFLNQLKLESKLSLLDVRLKNIMSLKGILYNDIKNIYKDEELLEFFIKNYTHFNDISKFKDETIYIYKLAQLLTSDILHVREVKEKIRVDYSNLVGCADYKIAQVLRNYGVLEFSENLSSLVDRKIEIKSNSIYEIEIRANTLVAINEIYLNLNKKIDRIEINDAIWLMGQNKKLMIKPYHRTYSEFY